MSGDERRRGPQRKHERIAIGVPVANEVEHLGAAPLVDDVSRGGIGLWLGGGVKVGDRLHFQLSLPTGPSCTVEGEIRRVQASADGLQKVGVQWLAKKPEQRLALSSYYANLRQVLG